MTYPPESRLPAAAGSRYAAGMTDPAPEQDDLTADDFRVEETGNGLTPEDPTEQPSQDPADLPEGTVVGVVEPPAVEQ